MDTHLGTNSIPMFVLLPILLIIAVGMGWMIVRAHVALWKRIALIVGGLFALFGMAVFMVTVYYKVSPNFASTFRFYAYTALAPAGDPFQTPNKDYRQALILREVVNKDGVISFLNPPNPSYPAMVAIFAPGKYIEADLTGDTLTIPPPPQDSLGRVTKTSLWWALTKDLTNIVSNVQ